MNQEETVEILNELLTSIRIRGFRKTINILKTEKKISVPLTDPFEIFIIDTICESFNIKQDDLIYSKYMRGDNKYAIGLCVYYLYEKKSLGDIHKSVFKSKNKTLLSKYRQIILDLKEVHSEDKKILEIKKEIDKAIETYKKLAKDGKSSNK
jgi:hypothetical protein